MHEKTALPAVFVKTSHLSISSKTLQARETFTDPIFDNNFLVKLTQIRQDLKVQIFIGCSGFVTRLYVFIGFSFVIAKESSRA